MKHATRIDQVDTLLDMVRDREQADSEADYNTRTVRVMESLLKLKFEVRKIPRPDWVLIMEALLAEIVVGKFNHPFKFDQEGGEDVLCIRTSHIMDSLRRGTWMRERWPEMTIRSDRILKKQLKQAGVLLLDSAGNVQEFERIGHNRCSRAAQRCPHMVAIKLEVLRGNGLNPSPAVLSTSNCVTL